MRAFVLVVIASLLLTAAPAPALAQTATSAAAPAPSGPLPLTAFPRPPHDNGLGVHWSTQVYGQPPATVDYFVDELAALGVHWVKFLNDGTEGRHNEYLVQQLAGHGIMPVMRIYTKCNKPLDLASLRRLVQHYRPMGVVYYEIFNEPELTGEEGGWCNGEQPDPERLLDLWLPAARAIEDAGGYPAIPSMFPPSLRDPRWRESFFMRFLAGIRRRGDTAVLYRAWGAVHNYFLNHPVDYPYDAVNLTGRPLTATEIASAGLNPAEAATMNQARAQQQGGFHVGDTVDDDPNCFLSFIAYRNRFVELFGFEIPLISTEGGATVGSSEDGRYPRLDENAMAAATLQAYAYMLDKAPAYYFAFTSWLLAEGAMGRPASPWESWAWYGNMTGDHLPVVDALKADPRHAAARGARPGAGPGVATVAQPAPGSRWRVSTPTPAAAAPAAATTATTAAGSLDRFPRPARDNGWGIHWAPTLFGQSSDTVDRFVAELSQMGIRWVKIMQPDEAKIEHTYLLQALERQGIMPVLRVYRADNGPYQHLGELVKLARPLGVYYYELYNEPNMAGTPGGWAPGGSVDLPAVAAAWLPAARAVVAAGGFPSVPAPTPGGDYEDTAFLADFVQRIVDAGGRDVLASSWLALHNYFLNHPLDYPADPVNTQSVPLSADEIAQRKLSPEQVTAINQARANSRLPRSQGGYYVGSTIDKDSNGFRKFEAYEAIAKRVTGLTMPIISTEGGAMPGTQEDPRYPAVNDQDVAERTAGAYTFMRDQAPDYYFAFTPWLMANQAMGNPDGQWESATWFRGGSGQAMPVVDAVRKLAQEDAGRPAQSTATPTGAPTGAPATGAPAAATPTPAPVAPTATPEPQLTPAPVPTAADPDGADTAWLIFWRDGQAFNCSSVQLAAAAPAVRAWHAPVDGHTWGMEIRSLQNQRLGQLGQPAPLGALPALCNGGPVEVAAGTARPTPGATPQATRVWDPRLTTLNIGLQEAPAVPGADRWRLVSAKFEDVKQAAGRHHIYIRLIDENGQPIAGSVTVRWSTGEYTLPVTPRSGNDLYDQYGANFPMYGNLGGYEISVDGSSDMLTGLGLPGKFHVDYLLVFQRTRG